MGEPTEDGETRDFQDRPQVNPAGAGRKNECLSREICFPARGLATRAAMGEDGMAEVSRGHSRMQVRRAEHVRDKESLGAFASGHGAENGTTDLGL